MDQVQRKWALTAIIAAVVVAIIAFSVFGLRQQAPTVQGTATAGNEAAEPAGGVPSNTSPSNNPTESQ